MGAVLSCRQGATKGPARPASETSEPASRSVSGSGLDRSQSWRGRRDQNTPPEIVPDVPRPEEIAYIPSFTISGPYDWALLANGEKVFDEASALSRLAAEAPLVDANNEKFESCRLLDDGSENVKTPPKIGENYLTSTGLPVRVLRVENGRVVLRNLGTDDIIVLPAAYPLEQFDEGEATSPIKPAQPELGPGRHSPVAKARKLLAPIIDTMLLKGGLSMQGIVRVLKCKASAPCRGKDLKANIRARIYWLRRKGCPIESHEFGRILENIPRNLK